LKPQWARKQRASKITRHHANNGVGSSLSFHRLRYAFIGETGSPCLPPFCCSISAIRFTQSLPSGRFLVTNRVRVLLAMLALILINAILYGQPIPLACGLPVGPGWAFGIIGLSLGDAFLFQRL